MMKEFEFKTNKVELESIYSYLNDRNEDFTPPLSSKLDVYEFARKMHKSANIYTIRYKGNIIGLAGCYANNFQTLEAYITNFSIHPNYYGTGLAEKLINYCLKDISAKGFKTIKLEVHRDNSRAMNFYSKIGFQIVENETKPKSIFMLKFLQN